MTNDLNQLKDLLDTGYSVICKPLAVDPSNPGFFRDIPPGIDPQKLKMVILYKLTEDRKVSGCETLYISEPDAIQLATAEGEKGEQVAEDRFIFRLGMVNVDHLKDGPATLVHVVNSLGKEMNLDAKIDNSYPGTIVIRFQQKHDLSNFHGMQYHMNLLVYSMSIFYRRGFYVQDSTSIPITVTRPDMRGDRLGIRSYYWIS